MMLDFICELEKVLPKWPASASWSIAQIADATETSVPQVVDYLSDTLDRELEVHETLSHVEATNALGILRDRMSVQLAAREKRIVERRDKAMKAYDINMEKVRVLLATKNWRSAYRTLIYFVGQYEKDVAPDLMFSLCGECLRLGSKAEANLQELSQWLRKGVAACLEGGAARSQESIEDALDFIDAYAELLFAERGADGEARGKRLVVNVLESLKVQADAHNLTPQYQSLAKELGLPS